MKFRYVVIDDAPFVRELLRGLLQAAGHVCVGEAGDGREGRDLVARTLPDLIFLDLVMPKKNGVAVARELRDLWPEGKIVACTTLACEEAGETVGLFDAWVGKPFNREQIEAVLQLFTLARRETSA